MDRLGMCMDELRVLARSNDPDRAVLVEAYSTPILLPRQSVCGKPWSASRHGTPPANSRMLIAYGTLVWAVAQSTRSITVASSASAFELLSRFDTGRRAASPYTLILAAIR